MRKYDIARVVKYSFLLTVLAATAAHAQDKPEGLLKQQAASTGKTEVAREGFAAAPEKPEEQVNATELSASAGGLFSAGNARTFSLTLASDFRLRRKDSQVTAAVSGNYARSAADAEVGMEPTVQNLQGRVRYDHFVARHFALFTALSARHDRFQGLDLRLNLDPGLAYYFIDRSKHLFWAELGYDLQHDLRSDRVVAAADAEGESIEATETRHHARAFVGYNNRVNEAVTLSTGVEYLQGLVPFDSEETGRINWRLNWDAAVTSAVSDEFSLATTFSLKYDNNPLPGVRNTDAQMAFNLVYKLL